MTNASSSAAMKGDETACAGSSPFSVVALDIGGTKVAGCIAVYEHAGACPKVMLKRSSPTDAERGGADVLARVCELAGELLADAQMADVPALAGVGVSSAGSIRESDGLVAFANEIMPGWMGQPLGAALQERCGLPVAVLNDVHAHALGELRHGAAKGARVALMVAAGTGLGGAVMIDGHLLGGAHGCAGTIGHTLHPAAVGRPSGWSGTGHLESVVAGSGIEECYRARGGEAISGGEISRRANEGEALAREVIEQSGRSLGESIASWADLIDPEVVVLAGSVCKAGSIWYDALRSGFEGFVLPEMADLRFADAVLGDDAPLIGAAEKLVDRLSAAQ